MRFVEFKSRSNNILLEANVTDLAKGMKIILPSNSKVEKFRTPENNGVFTIKSQRVIDFAVQFR